MMRGFLPCLKGSRKFSTSANIVRTCIVGSGPAGFYSSQYLLKHLPNCKVE